MFKVILVRQGGLEELEELLNKGWKIHDKTATQHSIIYVLWKLGNQGSAGN